MVIDMLNTSQAVDFFKNAKELSSRNRRRHLQNNITMPIPSYIEYAETSSSTEIHQDDVGKQRGGSFCKQAIEVANPSVEKSSSSSNSAVASSYLNHSNNDYEEKSSLKGVDSAEDSSGRSFSASCRSYEMDLKTGSTDSSSSSNNNNNGMQDVSFRSGGQSYRSSELVKAQQGSFSSTTSLTASFLTYLEESENGEGDHDDDDDDESRSSSVLRDDEESANLSCVVEEVSEEGHQQSSSSVEESSAEEAIKKIQYNNDSVQEAMQKEEANYGVHSQEDINIIDVDDRDGDMQEEMMNIVKDDDDTYVETNHNDDDDEQFEDIPVSQPQVPTTSLSSMVDIEVAEDRCYSPDGESLVSIDDDLSFAEVYDDDENDYEYLFSYELFMMPLHTIKEEDCCYEEQEEI